MAYMGTRDHAAHPQGGSSTGTAPCGNSMGDQERGHLHGTMMSTYFHFGRKVQLLFRDWAPSSPVTFILTLAAVLILAVFYEWFAELKRRSFVLLTDHPSSTFPSTPPPPPPKQEAHHPHFMVDGTDTATPSHQGCQNLYGALMVAFRRLMRHRQVRLAVVTGVHVVHSAMGYVLMLVVMSFNVSVFLSVLIGLAIGFFLFRVNHLQASSTHL